MLLDLGRQLSCVVDITALKACAKRSVAYLDPGGNPVNSHFFIQLANKISYVDQELLQ